MKSYPVRETWKHRRKRKAVGAPFTFDADQLLFRSGETIEASHTFEVSAETALGFVFEYGKLRPGWVQVGPDEFRYEGPPQFHSSGAYPKDVDWGRPLTAWPDDFTVATGDEEV